eukprot:659658-Rhodomonas_salina.2
MEFRFGPSSFASDTLLPNLPDSAAQLPTEAPLFWLLSLFLSQLSSFFPHSPVVPFAQTHVIANESGENTTPSWVTYIAKDKVRPAPFLSSTPWTNFSAEPQQTPPPLFLLFFLLFCALSAAHARCALDAAARWQSGGARRQQVHFELRLPLQATPVSYTHLTLPTICSV